MLRKKLSIIKESKSNKVKIIKTSSSAYVTLNSNIKEEETYSVAQNIKALEKEFEVVFPKSFVNTLKNFEGKKPTNSILFKKDTDQDITVIQLYCLSNLTSKKGIKKMYEILVDEYKVKNYIPFAHTPFGDLLCFRKPNMDIVFFDHETAKASKIFNDFDEFLNNAKPKKFMEHIYNLVENETEVISKLKKYVEDNEDTINTTGGVTVKEVEKAEKILDIKFSDELKEYLLTFGSIDSAGIEFYGLGNKVNKHLNIVLQTQEAREKDDKFPSNHVVFESSEDGHLFYTVDDKNNVYKYVNENKTRLEKLSMKFESYILSKLKRNNKK